MRRIAIAVLAGVSLTFAGMAGARGANDPAPGTAYMFDCTVDSLPGLVYQATVWVDAEDAPATAHTGDVVTIEITSYASYPVPVTLLRGALRFRSGLNATPVGASELVSTGPVVIGPNEIYESASANLSYKITGAAGKHFELRVGRATASLVSYGNALCIPQPGQKSLVNIVIT